MDLIVCVGDEAYEHERNSGQVNVPFLAPHTMQNGKYAIPFPIRERFLGVSFMLQFWNLKYKAYAHAKEEETGPPWESRKNQAFFRGEVYNKDYPAQTRGNRLALLELSGRHRDLLDAGDPGINSLPPQMQEQIPPTVPRVKSAMKEHFVQDDQHPPEVKLDTEYENWKYVVSIGGQGGWADRLMEDIFRTLVLINVDEGSSDFFWPVMKTFEDYIPVDPQMEQLIPCIEGLLDSDDAALAMARTMKKKAKEHLQPHKIAEYGLQVLRRYRQLFGPHRGRLRTSISINEWVHWAKQQDPAIR
eukprot:TRINITY_DN93651_c0_g1_i1.p1 TRINITY_DN93651_c0_g1~~TRINITY_DN93651_c0_g1_i1.p1  ORF type:complete len:333 (-),score=32.16 TRINITY_DN93651_c0_g1_i1:90-995(-)